MDFIDFFRRCLKGLKANGIIVVKDNAITDPKLSFCIDRDDSSVCRNLAYIKLLLTRAGLKVVKEKPQRDFPSELYPVYMLALTGELKNFN